MDRTGLAGSASANYIDKIAITRERNRHSVMRLTLRKSGPPNKDRHGPEFCRMRRTTPMGFKRRGFLKVVTTGLALGCADFDGVLARPPGGTPDSELLAGSGTVHLEGKLKSGTMTLEAQDFLDRTDRSVVVRGRLVSAGSDWSLYSAMFSYQNDL